MPVEKQASAAMAECLVIESDDADRDDRDGGNG